MGPIPAQRSGAHHPLHVPGGSRRGRAGPGVKARPASVALATGLFSGWVLWPPLAGAHAQPTTTVQFDREIVRILDDHCVMCHADQDLAFPLITYEQTYASRWQI